MIVRRAADLVSHGLRATAGTTPGTDDNLIVCVRARSVQYSLERATLVLRCAWDGREETVFEGRRVWVDDDCWLLVQRPGPIHARIDSESEVQSLTIVFRPGFAEDVLGALVTADDLLLSRPDRAPQLVLPFLPHLQPHDRVVSPVIHFIRRHCEAGLDDPLWYEEQLAFLLERLLIRHRQIVDSARGLPARRAATRREIFRRVALATDFIHSSYQRQLALKDMASAACLSRHHFLRLFKTVHHMTPHEFLQRKRTLVAARLLSHTDLPVTDVVRRVGFDSRSTLFRSLRRFHGLTPRDCRRLSEYDHRLTPSAYGIARASEVAQAVC